MTAVRCGPLLAAYHACRHGLVAVLLAVAVAACSPVRTVEAVRLLTDVAAGPGDRAVEAAAARRREVAYAVEGRPRRADLYPPPDDEAESDG